MEELAERIYQGLRHCSVLTNNPRLLEDVEQKCAAGTWTEAAVEMHVKENPHVLKWYASDFFDDTHRPTVAEETGLTGVDLDAEMQARWLDEVMMHGETLARRRHAPLIYCSKFCELRTPPVKKPKRAAADCDLSVMPPAEMTVAQLLVELNRLNADTRAAKKPTLIARLMHARQNSQST